MATLVFNRRPALKLGAVGDPLSPRERIPGLEPLTASLMDTGLLSLPLQ